MSLVTSTMLALAILEYAGYEKNAPHLVWQIAYSECEGASKLLHICNGDCNLGRRFHSADSGD